MIICPEIMYWAGSSLYWSQQQQQIVSLLITFIYFIQSNICMYMMMAIFFLGSGYD